MVISRYNVSYIAYDTYTTTSSSDGSSNGSSSDDNIIYSSNTATATINITTPLHPTPYPEENCLLREHSLNWLHLKGSIIGSSSSGSSSSGGSGSGSGSIIVDGSISSNTLQGSILHYTTASSSGSGSGSSSVSNLEYISTDTPTTTSSSSSDEIVYDTSGCNINPATTTATTTTTSIDTTHSFIYSTLAFTLPIIDANGDLIRSGFPEGIVYSPLLIIPDDSGSSGGSGGGSGDGGGGGSGSNAKIIFKETNSEAIISGSGGSIVSGSGGSSGSGSGGGDGVYSVR